MKLYDENFCASMKTMEYSFPLHFPIFPFLSKSLKQKLDLDQRCQERNGYHKYLEYKELFD